MTALTSHLIRQLIAPKGYWYLATPYSLYPGGLDTAYREACEAQGALVEKGVRVFCPIAHSHGAARYGPLKARDHDLWMRENEPFMKDAHGLLVLMMPTWVHSLGILAELAEFARMKKPRHYLDWPL